MWGRYSDPERGLVSVSLCTAVSRTGTGGAKATVLLMESVAILVLCVPYVNSRVNCVALTSEIDCCIQRLQSAQRFRFFQPLSPESPAQCVYELTATDYG